MIFRRTHWVGALSAAVVVAAYSIGRAGSPFPAGQDPPVLFSGSLNDNGTPLTGSHQIALSLWQTNDTSTTSNRICTGAPQTVNVDAGNFQVPLDSACTALFSRHSQIYYQLTVDGTAFPLQQVGAVPFAARSLDAPSNGARLVQERTITYGDDGYRSAASYGKFTDTKRNETCTATATYESGNTLSRCLPDAAGDPGESPYDTTATTNGVQTFSDSVCTTAFPTNGVRYYVSNHPYVVDLQAPGNAGSPVATIYPAAVETLSTYQLRLSNSGGCLPAGSYACCPTTTLYRYTLGSPLALTEFVQFQTVTQ